MSVYDKRLHAVRPDLADVRLKDRVDAARYVTGRPARIAVPVADMRSAPRGDAGLSTQLLLGDDVLLFDESEGWAWVQAERDGYVGYVGAAALAGVEPASTHVVSVPRTFIYPGPDLKLPRSGELSMGSQVAVVGHAETRGTLYALLASGEALIARHLIASDAVAADYVAVAETLLNTPYLWGGTTGFGIDCSGLVQLSMRMAGIGVLRDTDMQAASIGHPVFPGPDLSGLERGDLVFWKGHVGIMTNDDWLLHASGHTMMVSRERLADAVARIGYLYGGPTDFRRPEIAAGDAAEPQ